MITKFKAFFTRTLGIILTTVLIASGLTVLTPTAAYANETLTNPPTKVTLKTDNITTTTTDITATVDVPLEESSTIASLYKVGTPTTIDTADTGTNFTFTVSVPTGETLYEQYYVQIGDIKSNLVTVYSSSSTWQINIATVNDLDSFKTSDAAPRITWNTNKNINPLKSVHILRTDTNKTVYTSSTGMTGGWNSIKFITEPKVEYYAVIADSAPVGTDLNTINGIVASSNSLYISRATWDISLTIDKNIFSTADSDPVLTWNTNQPINSSYTPSNYVVYIVDKDENIIKRITTSSPISSSNLKVRPYIDNNFQYTAYVAANDSTATKLENLTDIQAVSETVNLQRTSWTLKVSIDQETFNTDSPTPLILWNTNQPVGNTGKQYILYFADTNTGSIFYRSPDTLTSNGNVTIPRFYNEQFKEYIGYIARKAPTGTTYNNVSQLIDIQATSNTVRTERAAWEITLDIDKTIFTTDETTPQITWNTNQSISATNNAYRIYFIDTTENTVIGSLNAGYLKTGKYNIPKFYTGGKHTYKAYVAKSYPTTVPLPKTLNELEDIQAISNTVEAERAPWEVNISIDKTVFNTDDATPVITWVANQSISNSQYKYLAYLVDDETGEVIGQSIPGAYSGIGNQSTFSIPRFYTEQSKSYSVYIAHGGRTNDVILPTNVSEMRDIQAISNSVSTQRDTWSLSIGIDKTIFTTDDKAPVISWSTNQTIAGSAYNYVVYLVDNSTEKIVGSTFKPYYSDISSSGNLNVRFETGGPRSYTAYVAKGGNIYSPSYTPPTELAQLKDIQATSNTVSTQRAVWNLDLKLKNKEYIGAPVNDPDAKIKYTVEWNANQTIFAGAAYDIYLYANGKILGKPASWNWDGKSLWATYTAPPTENVTFIAYIAKREGTYSTSNDLVDIQAVSNVLNEDSISKEVLNQRYKGGTNPSEGNCNQQCYGDPINSYNGEFFENHSDLTIQNPIPFNFTRSYSSNSLNETGAFGTGWTHNFNMNLKGNSNTLLGSDRIKVTQENGSVTRFTKITSNGEEIYVAPGSTLAKLKYDSELDKIILTRLDNTNYIFNSLTGKLESIKDINNNTLTLNYTLDKLISVVSNNGKTLSILWNLNGTISSISDGIQSVNYSYSPNGNVEIVDLPNTLGNKQYIYNSKNQITSLIQTNGGSFRNEYDNEGRVIKQTNPLNQETSFIYSTNETQITLPNNVINREKYNIYGQLVESTYALGTPEEAKYSYDYDYTGQVSLETDPLGNTTKYVHDMYGNVIHVTNAKNSTVSFTYNSLNKIVEATNALGDKALNEYDLKGNLIKSTSFEGKITEYEVNPNGTNNTIKSPNDYVNNTNKKIAFGYDSNGHLSSTKNPEGGTLTVTSNQLGNPLTVTDPLNNTTSYTYNTQNQLVETLAPNGATTEAEYDNAGQVIKTVDELGNETVTTYNLMGNVVTTTTPLGTVTYEYDNMQRVIKVANIDGGETEYEYDKLGRVIKTTDPLNNETHTSYTKHSLVSSTTDSLGNTTTYEYDAVGNTTKIKDALNNESIAVYDSLNRLTSTTSASGYTETYTYDDDNNLLSVTKAGLETTSYEYDNNANLIKTVYPDSSTEERTYNSDNELLTIKDRDGKITSYQYNAGGQVTKTIRPDSTEVVYSYTNMGELDSISYDNWATIDTEFVYNIAGQITSEYKNGVETTYSYDAIGNLTKRGPPTGNKVEYDYNTYGQVKETQYPNGLILNYEYDLNGNLKKVKKNSSVLTEYIYDANGNNTRINYSNGTYEENSYDELNRLEQLTVNNNNQLYKKELELNNIGLIVGNKTTNNNTVTEDKTYTYTPTQRLENVTDSVNSQNNTYSYDTSHNLLSSNLGTNSFTSNGQITGTTKTNISVTYAHDLRGNRTNKTVKDTASVIKETTEYSWSPDNSLSNFTLNNTSNSSLDRDIDYSYDANGLLTDKTNNLLNSSETYTWDTLSGIPTLLEDADNSYIYGLGSAPFAQIDKSSNEITYLHGDERGSIILATDDSGAKEWSRSYDEYGSSFAQTPSTGVVTPFAYAGEYLDEDTNLYNLRARWYEAETASFISIDPALSSTGEAYSYASANPLSFTDPLGLWSMQNTWNSVVGFVDGITGVPILSSVSNLFAPGSVQTCSPEYNISNLVGNVASIVIPGGWAFNVLKLGHALSVGKIWKYEKVWIDGLKAKWVDASKYRRFNSQNPAYGEAAKHNADVLKGRKILTTRETKTQKDINRRENLRGVSPAGKNTKGQSLENDEVYPASTSASRNKASSVRAILKEDNQLHGRELLKFYYDSLNQPNKALRNPIKPGDSFIYE